LSLANALKVKMGGKRKSAVAEPPSTEDPTAVRLVDAEAEARWSKLDDEGLTKEVGEYRCVSSRFLFIPNPVPSAVWGGHTVVSVSPCTSSFDCSLSPTPVTYKRTRIPFLFLPPPLLFKPTGRP
jgi:hypothetical protein